MYFNQNHQTLRRNSLQPKCDESAKENPTLMMIICRLLLFIHMKLMANANGSERVSVFEPRSPPRKRSRTTHAHTHNKREWNIKGNWLNWNRHYTIFFSFHFSHFILILCLPACTTFPFRYGLCDCGRQRHRQKQIIHAVVAMSVAVARCSAHNMWIMWWFLFERSGFVIGFVAMGNDTANLHTEHRSAASVCIYNFADVVGGTGRARTLTIELVVDAEGALVARFICFWSWTFPHFDFAGEFKVHRANRRQNDRHAGTHDGERTSWITAVPSTPTTAKITMHSVRYSAMRNGVVLHVIYYW